METNRRGRAREDNFSLIKTGRPFIQTQNTLFTCRVHFLLGLQPRRRTNEAAASAISAVATLMNPA